MSHRLLTRDAVERAMRALRRIKSLAEGSQVDEYLAFATSAIREAGNGGDFIRHVACEIGIDIRAIPGHFEAHLIYKGVREAVELPEPTLIVDIGGGSTEFIVGTSEKALFEVSLKIGAARMTERFVTTDPVSREQVEDLRAHLQEQIKPLLDTVRTNSVQQMVGSSGTLENFAEVCRDTYGDASRSIFQQVFKASDMRKVTRTIIESTRSERRVMEGIDTKRVVQAVAGAVLFNVLLEETAIQKVRLSPYALREGMVVHFIEKNHDRLQRLAPIGDVKRRQIYELADRFDRNKRHSRHVAALALQLFDESRALHDLGLEDRKLLEFAALLHDIGYSISRRKHHKHSRYLIEQADWKGFQPEEIGIIANVARYHRKALPKKKHKPFKKLSETQRRVVRILASFLRLAEGMDRSQFQNVQKLSVDLGVEKLRITLQTRADPELELWAIRRSVDLFEQALNREVVVQAAWSPE
jgi:exopolyphosphatase/guanosine-5'-triphosphate,3'-diphosphate pyrophosphatase